MKKLLLLLFLIPSLRALLRKAKWGQETGKLHFSQIGIALSLFRMASSNWTKSPSEKQAKSAMKIIKTFNDNKKENSILST